MTTVNSHLKILGSFFMTFFYLYIQRFVLFIALFSYNIIVSMYMHTFLFYAFSNWQFCFVFNSFKLLNNKNNRCTLFIYR